MTDMIPNDMVTKEPAKVREVALCVFCPRCHTALWTTVKQNETAFRVCAECEMDYAVDLNVYSMITAKDIMDDTIQRQKDDHEHERLVLAHDDRLGELERQVKYLLNQEHKRGADDVSRFEGTINHLSQRISRNRDRIEEVHEELVVLNQLRKLANETKQVPHDPFQ